MCFSVRPIYVNAAALATKLPHLKQTPAVSHIKQKNSSCFSHSKKDSSCFSHLKKWSSHFSHWTKNYPDISHTLKKCPDISHFWHDTNWGCFNVQVWFSSYLTAFDTFDITFDSTVGKNKNKSITETSLLQSHHQISIWISIQFIKAKQIERRCLVSQRPIKRMWQIWTR